MNDAEYLIAFRKDAEQFEAQGTLRTVLYWTLMQGVVVPLLMARYLSWNSPKTTFQDLAVLNAIVFVPIGLLSGLIYRKTIMASLRKSGLLPMRAKGRGNDESQSGSYAPVRKFGVVQKYMLKVGYPRRLAWLAAIILAVWFAPAFVDPAPGGVIDRAWSGAHHNSSEAVYVGFMEFGERTEREDILKFRGRCVSQPVEEPQEDWLCGEPAKWVVVWTATQSYESEDVRTFESTTFRTACDVHRELVEGEFGLDFAPKFSNPVLESNLRTVAWESWKPPKRNYYSL